MHGGWGCTLSLVTGSTPLTNGETFAQTYRINSAETRGAGALATATLAILLAALSTRAAE